MAVRLLLKSVPTSDSSYDMREYLGPNGDSERLSSSCLLLLIGGGSSATITFNVFPQTVFMCNVLTALRADSMLAYFT